ncbi:TOTE conflict system archaeo-eukaryotic primase domain-containing protein [Bacillus sp. B1-b2]|uniref:TOTE conflict system archaeo-eukaryotic primase domain-containing protein n=1 Tax=Bacillus sp. B1-b2 TaxID=2653201 RepID=UPI001262A555|nr:hypothetical protein [Bacillus sp. B1-b2]KAB7668932.1 hypothetical protein F9279_12060 [Bacillus sp. B1-b2]
MENMKQIVEAISDLFISVRYKYIMQLPDGDYTFYNKYKKKSHKSLADWQIKLHLQHESTYGIFSYKENSKFISFDVDFPEKDTAKQAVYALYEVLQNLRIPKELIYTSNSGNKGYHVDIYFSNPIDYKSMKKLYDVVIDKTQELLGRNIKRKIELRPQHNKGMKLPLGINHKNKNKKTNICWYVDVYNNFMPIESYDYILAIKKLNSNLITDLLSNIEESDEEKNSKNNSAKRDKDKEDNKDTDNDKEKDKTNEDSNFHDIDLSNETFATCRKLYEEGMKQKGTRNASLCKLAVYRNSLGIEKNICEEELFEWMKRQDPVLYSTPLSTCRKEIKRIVKSAYNNNIRLSGGVKQVEISKSEMLSLYQYDKKLRAVIFSLMVHSKRFSAEDNNFYMSYEQLKKSTGLSPKSLMNHVAILEKNNVIKVTRSPTIFDGVAPRNYPNTYQVLLNKLSIPNDIIKEMTFENVSDYRKQYFNLLTSMFTIEEIGDINNMLAKATNSNE